MVLLGSSEPGCLAFGVAPLRPPPAVVRFLTQGQDPIKTHPGGLPGHYFESTLLDFLSISTISTACLNSSNSHCGLRGMHSHLELERPGPSRSGCRIYSRCRDGKHLAGACRIKALWRLHCCALAVCGFGEGDRPVAQVILPRAFPELGGSSIAVERSAFTACRSRKGTDVLNLGPASV